MTAQLDAAALHATARDPEAPAPSAFVEANAALERAERGYREAVQARHELIRVARTLGVSWVALARWTGINVRTLHDIAGNHPPSQRS